MSKDFGLKKYNPTDYAPHEDLQKMLNKAEFVLKECDRNAMGELWRKYSTQSKEPNDVKISWISRNEGLGWNVGIFHKMPVFVEFRITVMDGISVLTYNPTSVLVHYEMIERWMKQFCPAFSKDNCADEYNFYEFLLYKDNIKKVA